MANVLFDYNTNGPWTYVAGAALAAGTYVKLSTVSGQVLNTAVGDLPIGFVADDVLSGAPCTVYPSHGEFFVKAAGVFAVGDYLKLGAAGQLVVEAVSTVPTINTVAQARGVGAAASLAAVYGYY